MTTDTSFTCLESPLFLNVQSESLQNTLDETSFKTHSIASSISKQTGQSPPFPLSHKFVTSGVRAQGILVCTINGICTPFSIARQNGEYLAKMASGVQVECIYNQTHGPIVDLMEVLFLNYSGLSPVTADLLCETWTEFHEAHKDHPHAKILQICHSQGAVHVRNALINTSPEIRERLIIVAIAPATILPDGLCFQSYHYMSQNDFVSFGEFFRNRLLCGPDSELCDIQAEQISQLILLPPHPRAPLFDHDFQSPTYRPILEAHIQEYLNNYWARP